MIGRDVPDIHGVRRAFDALTASYASTAPGVLFAGYLVLLAAPAFALNCKNSSCFPAATRPLTSR